MILRALALAVLLAACSPGETPEQKAAARVAKWLAYSFCGCPLWPRTQRHSQ